MLKRGTVAINGNTGEVLGRSLTALREVVDRTLSEVRLASGKQRHERLQVVTFLDEIAATGVLHSNYRRIEFTVEPVDPSFAIDGDPQLLTSAVMNLLHNAFKNTPAGGTAARSHSQHAREGLRVRARDAVGCRGGRGPRSQARRSEVTITRFRK